MRRRSRSSGDQGVQGGNIKENVAENENSLSTTIQVERTREGQSTYDLRRITTLSRRRTARGLESGKLFHC